MTEDDEEANDDDEWMDNQNIIHDRDHGDDNVDVDEDEDDPPYQSIQQTLDQLQKMTDSLRMQINTPKKKSSLPAALGSDTPQKKSCAQPVSSFYSEKQKKRRRSDSESPKTKQVEELIDSDNSESPKTTPKKTKPKRKWTDAKLSKLCALWEDEPHLYDASHPDYRKNNLKIKTVERIAALLDMDCKYLSLEFLLKSGR